MSDEANVNSTENQRKVRRTIVGVVTSDKTDKSITVQVDRMVQHPRFKKYVRKSTKYNAHDEKNEAHVGDRVHPGHRGGTGPGRR